MLVIRVLYFLDISIFIYFSTLAFSAFPDISSLKNRNRILNKHSRELEISLLHDRERERERERFIESRRDHIFIRSFISIRSSKKNE